MTGISRRALLARGLGAACCLAATPLVTPVTLAATPGENRLVVIVLRGALDGLGGLPAARRSAARAAAAVARGRRRGRSSSTAGSGCIPRSRRCCRSGGAASSRWRKRWRRPIATSAATSTGRTCSSRGWSTPDAGARRLAEPGARRIPGARAETALSVGREGMLLLRGPEPVQAWSPGDTLALRNDERGLLERLYRDDPLFREAALAAESLSGLDPGEDPGEPARRPDRAVRGGAAGGGGPDRRVLDRRLGHPSRPGERDPAAAEAAGAGDPDARGEPRAGLGPDARRGDDRVRADRARERQRRHRPRHRRRGAARRRRAEGGRVLGRWPGLAEGALYQGRDLMPTADVRSYPAWALAELFGLERATIEREIFPSLDMGTRSDFLGLTPRAVDHGAPVRPLGRNVLKSGENGPANDCNFNGSTKCSHASTPGQAAPPSSAGSRIDRRIRYHPAGGCVAFIEGRSRKRAAQAASDGRPARQLRASWRKSR